MVARTIIRMIRLEWRNKMKEEKFPLETPYIDVFVNFMNKFIRGDDSSQVGKFSFLFYSCYCCCFFLRFVFYEFVLDHQIIQFLCLDLVQKGAISYYEVMEGSASDIQRIAFVNIVAPPEEKTKPGKDKTVEKKEEEKPLSAVCKVLFGVFFSLVGFCQLLVLIVFFVCFLFVCLFVLVNLLFCFRL
jgi:hypothetical protein